MELVPVEFLCPLNGGPGFYSRPIHLELFSYGRDHT